jgi:hypothetical protein
MTPFYTIREHLKLDVRAPAVTLTKWAERRRRFFFLGGGDFGPKLRQETGSPS